MTRECFLLGLHAENSFFLPWLSLQMARTWYQPSEASDACHEGGAHACLE